jgi:hypothetical protein
MATIAEVRDQYPQYADWSDQELGDALYKKFYSDMPRDEYDRQVGLSTRGGSSLARGIDELQGNLYSAAEGAGRLTGIASLERFGRAGRERNEQEAEESLPSSAKRSFADATGISGYGQAALQALGMSLPSSAGPLAGAAAGAALGAPLGPVGVGIGSLLGGTAAAIPQFFGANRQRQIEASTERDERGQVTKPGEVSSELGALVTAVPQAGVEALTDRFTLGLGRLLGLGKETVARTVLPRIARGIGLGAVAEMPTEVMQQAMERAQAGLDVLSPAAMSEYKEAAIAAGFVGGAMGGTAAGAFGPRPETSNDRDKELEKSLETLRAAAQQNLKDQQLSLGQRPIETPIGVLTPQQIMEYAANSNDPRMLSIVASRASEPGPDAPRVRGRNIPVDPTGLTDTQRVDAIVRLMAEPAPSGTLYSRVGERSDIPRSEGRVEYGLGPVPDSSVMTEEELRQNDIRRSEAGPAFDIAAEGRRPRVEEGATQDPRWRATATKGEEDLREIPVVPGTNGRPVPVAAAGYALVTERNEDGEEVQVPRPFVAEIDPRTGEFVEGAEPFQYTDDMRKVTKGVLYPRPGVTNRAMAEMFDASQTARARAEGNQSLSQVTNQARATDRVGTNADMPGADGQPPYGTAGRPPRYQPPATEEKGPRAPRASLDSGFAEAAAYQGDNIPSAEDFTAERAFFGGPAAAQAKPPAARPKKVAPPAPPPAPDLFNRPAGGQTTASGSVPSAPVAPAAAPEMAAPEAAPPTPPALAQAVAEDQAAPPVPPAPSIVREYAAGDPTLEQRVRDFERVGSPEAKALVAEADAAAQAIEGLYAATGQTRETAHQGGPGTLGYQLKKRQSELMGATHRLIAGEVALRKNYMRGSEDRVAADMAGLRKMLEEEIAPAQPKGTAPVQTPDTPAPEPETDKPAPETDKPADPVEALRSYTEALQAGQTPDSAAAVAALGAYQGQPLAYHHIGRLAAFLDMPKAAVARIRAALPRGATIDDWQRAVAAEVAAKPKTNEENRATMATRRAAGAGDPDAKRLVDSAKTARVRRDQAQKELAEAREARKDDFGVNGATRMIGGLSAATARVTRAQRDYHAAVAAVGQADAAVAAYRPASEAAKPAAETDKPAAETGKPRRSTTIQTVSGMKVSADYELVDLDSLQAAKGATQPRDRSRAASEGQIADLYRTFDPAQVIEGAGASVGTPIIGPDSTVESGNGRVAAMRRLREEAPERWAAYQQALRDAGYDPGPNQVLVRRRTSELSPEELRRFVTDANSSPTLGMSGTERGMVDRDLIDQSLLSQLDTDADLFAASNDRFVRAFIGKLPANERATMLDGDGRLSQDGARRIEGAILARAYGDPALLQRIVEDRDDDTRSVSKALLSAAPAWIGLQDAVRRGEVKPEFDATPRLLDAVRMLRDMRARKLKANDFLAQQDVFTQPDPLATAFFRLFFNDSLTRAAGAEKISQALERYVGEAEKRSPNPLFPDDTTPLQALEAARKDPQGGLFSSREGGVQPTPGTVSADVEKARKVVANRLAELRAMGKQGVKAAEGVERAMREGFSPQQVVAAFRIAETAARILGNRSLVIRFLPEIMHEGIERQGELRHVSPEGTNGLVHFSLSKSSLAFARQTGAHEAFHVAQALFSASEPGVMAALKTAFPEGKGLVGIDPTLKRKLQTLQTPDGRGTYWDQLTRDKGVMDETGSDEIQAYVFGALDEARRHGQSLVGIPAMLLRFLNFLAELRQRLGSALRGDGFRSVGDTLAAVSKGTGIRGLSKAADIRLTAYDKSAPRRTEKSTDTLDALLAGRLAPRPEQRPAMTIPMGSHRRGDDDGKAIASSRNAGGTMNIPSDQQRDRMAPRPPRETDNGIVHPEGGANSIRREDDGEAASDFDQALKDKGLFSSRTGDTLQNLQIAHREPMGGGMVYQLTGDFGAGGQLQVYATVDDKGHLNVQDIWPSGVESNPHRFETQSTIPEYKHGVRLGPAETRKMFRALSTAAREDGNPVRSVSGTRETGARLASGQQDLAYNLGNARFSSRRAADLAADPTISKGYEDIKRDPVSQSWLGEQVRKFTGAVEGERWQDALYRNNISRAGPAYIYDQMRKAKGDPDQRSFGRMMDGAFNHSGRIELVLEHGMIGYDPKTDRTYVRDDAPSLLKALIGPDKKSPRVKASELDDFQVFLARLRERDLNRSGRSGFLKLKPAEVLAAIKATEARRPQWKDAAADIDKMNKALLDYGVATGTLDPVKAKDLAGIFYTPFYREVEKQGLAETEQGRAGPVVGNSLNNPHAFEKSVHESEEPIGNLLENLIKNYDSILRSGEKNVVLRAVSESMANFTNAKGEKLAEKIAYRKDSDRQVVTFKIGGQPVMYRMNKDPTASAIFLAMVGMPAPMRGALFQAAAGLAGIFRTGVTSLPSYMLANVYRGKWTAYVQEGLGLHTNTLQGMKQVYQASTTLKDFMAETGFGGFTHGMGEKNVAAVLDRQLRTRSGEATLWDRWNNGIAHLQKMSESTELGDRLKLMDKLIAGGMSKGEAAHQAYLLAPYSRKGMGGGYAGAALAWLTPLVPFLNSKIQGLARMFENDKGKKRIVGMPSDVFLRGMVLMAFSTAAYALASDDDRWKDESVERRLLNDIIYTPAGPIYLPRPFEFGLAFGAIPTFLMNAVRSERGGEDLHKALVQAVMSTALFNPLPQAAVPLLEVAFNYDMFRQRPLESQSLEGLPVSERKTEQTSTVAKLASSAVSAVDETVLPQGSRLELSPVKVQKLIEGYTGSIGTMMLAALDGVLGAVGAIPQKPGSGIFGSPSSAAGMAATLTGMGRFIRSDDDTVSRFVGDFYTVKRLADQTARNLNEAMLVGDQDKARSIIEENRPILAARSVLEGVERQISTLNRAMRAVAEREDMSLDQRRQVLAEYRRMRNDLSRRAVEATRAVQ